MFEMSILTAAIVYSTLGVVVGILVATGVFYSFTYSKIKHKNTQLRDACLLYQKQLTQLLNKNKSLEIQVREAKVPAATGAGAAPSAPPPFADPNDEKLMTASDDERSDWNQERQKLAHAQDDLRNRSEQLEQEKLILEQSLEQASGRWKEERTRLQEANKELRGRVDSGSDLESVEKLRDHQAAWKRAQHLLQHQLGKLKSDKKVLETELVSQVGQAEREKQALEDEIELLTERMMRLQIDEENQQQNAASAGVNAEEQPLAVADPAQLEALDELAAVDGESDESYDEITTLGAVEEAKKTHLKAVDGDRTHVSIGVRR